MEARQVTLSVTAIGECGSVLSYSNFAVDILFLSIYGWRCVVWTPADRQLRYCIEVSFNWWTRTVPIQVFGLLAYRFDSAAEQQ
jgi:hypothetical protein